MAIGMSPFYALYGYHPLSFVDVIFGDSRAPRAKIWIQESQDILQALKDNMATTQNQQKLYIDKGSGGEAVRGRGHGLPTITAISTVITEAEGG